MLIDRLFNIKTIVIVGLITLMGGGLPSITRAIGATQRSTVPETITPEKAVSFEDCALLAIRQSPFLTKSALEIELRRLDETDSRYSFIPTVKFHTRYYVDQPTTWGIHPRAYTLQFLSDGYNPLVSYFSLQANKALTQIAILGHLKIISAGLHRLAKRFLELETMKRLAASQTEMVNLAQKNFTYAQERLKLGEITSLEVRVATQEIALAHAEQERLAASQDRVKEAIESFVGLSPDQKLAFDLRQVRRQVVSSFNVATASLEQVRAHSFELKMQALKKKLQDWNISLAKTRLLPNIFFGVQTPDPLSMVDDTGYYFSVGLTWPIWDGLQRYRNISRQKTILRQYNTEMNLTEIDLSKKWQEARENLRSAEAAVKLAQAEEELGRLRERQSEIRYHTGGEPLSVFLEGRKRYLEAQKSTALKTLEYDRAVLGLRYLTGDLVYSYVDESSWQN